MSSGADFSPRRLKMLMQIRLLAVFFNLGIIDVDHISDLRFFDREFKRLTGYGLK